MAEKRVTTSTFIGIKNHSLAFESSRLDYILVNVSAL